MTKKRTKKKGGSASTNIINNPRLSTGNIRKKNIKNKGLIHATEAIGINALRGFGTGIANLFGKGGFESKLYDDVKQAAFKIFENKLKENPKLYIGNIKIDIETTKATIFCHLVGTMYELT